MKIRGIIWLDTIVDKIQRKHNVRPEEAEEIFKDEPKYFFVEKGHVKGEDLYSGIGKTSSGRLLIVYFILKARHQALVVSARDATKNEQKRYEKG